jgi:murein DD-endopeptidase MepM/ murein hydrolase activator NlpD
MVAENRHPKRQWPLSAIASFRNRHQQFFAITSQCNARKHRTCSRLRFVMTASVGLGIILTIYFLAGAVQFSYSNLVRIVNPGKDELIQQYENRIAGLRLHLDQIESRHQLENHTLRQKLFTLLNYQNELKQRSVELKILLQKLIEHPVAEGAGNQAVLLPAQSAIFEFDLRGSVVHESRADRLSTNHNLPSYSGAGRLENQVDSADDFATIEQSIKLEQASQEHIATRLHDEVSEKIQTISVIFASLGMEVSGDKNLATGGPFLPIADDAGDSFNTNHYEALAMSVETFNRYRNIAASVPLWYPVGKKPVSSVYGARTDPFNGKTALHSGVDFLARENTPVKPAANGTILKAGRNAGYGNMIEIEHSYGMVTRYAHLKQILVTPGERVTRDTIIGKVGSTGRSTGPHLHFEIHHDGIALDPARFMHAGQMLEKYL